MDYKTNWKDFLQYDEHGRRVHDFPSYVVDTAPGEKNYMYRGEYEAMVAAEKAVKNAARAARQAELAASRPNSTNSSVTPSVPASGSLPNGPFVPDLKRHSRRCLICSHPDRDAIEGEFIRWRSPHKIAHDYSLSDRASIYRHAHATDLFAERRRHVGRVLESFLETIDDNPPADFDPVTRAVRVYAHLNANGAWFEPLRKVHITTSHVVSPNSSPGPGPDSDPDLDPEPESHLNLDIEDNPQPERINELDEETRVPAGTAEGSPGRESGEQQRPEPPTSGPAFQDRPSRASHENSQAKEFRSAEGGTSTKVAASRRDNSFSRHSSLATSHCPQPNRNNPKIEISSNPHQTNDIPKVNRNKNIESASLHFRPAHHSTASVPARFASKVRPTISDNVNRRRECS